LTVDNGASPKQLVLSTDIPAPPVQEAPKKFEAFSNLASGLQALVVAASVLAGGAWAYFKFSVLLEAKKAVAEAQKAEAEAETARRIARASAVLSIELVANQIADVSSEEKWVAVELSLRNTGNEPIRIDLEKNIRFYLARVTDASDEGVISYGDRHHLKFDYPDKTITWFIVRPGADNDKYRTVQRVSEPGLYIARFSVEPPGSSEGPSHEYNGQTFFYVN
jgi:hypothetical protein